MQGYRKVIGLVIMAVLLVVAEFSGDGVSDGARESLVWLYGLFAGGNAAEHLTTWLKDRVPSTSDVVDRPVERPPLTD